MGIYKRCPHKGRDRDRCSDPWYATYELLKTRRVRVALAKWTGRDVRTKTEALKAFDDLKTEIRAGRFAAAGLGVSRPSVETSGPLTFAWLLVMYETHYVKAKQLRTSADFTYRTKILREAFRNDPLSTLTANRIEDFQATLRARAKAEGKSTAWVNRPISLLRAILNWAVKRQYIDACPTFELDKEDCSRWRRLNADEERRLLDAATPALRALLILALDTGVRRGEMLALRVGDVDLDKNVIRLRGETTKDAETRDLPILTERLRGVLAWLAVGDQGVPRPALAPLVLGAAGEALGDFRYHWSRCRLLAYGFTPKYATANVGLVPESRAQLQQIDLHWHDLRHEFACRLDDRGVALGKIQRLLGHASISTTERYLRRGLKDLQTIVLDDGTLPAVSLPTLSSQPVRESGRPPAVGLNLRKTGTDDDTGR